MELGQIQRVLAQIYTDTAFRERFFADPQAVGRTSGLNGEESRQLAQLSMKQANVFAASLKRKRLNEVQKLLPLTQRVLGQRFSALFQRYADTQLPTGIKKHRQDAIAFSVFVQQMACTERLEPPWIGALARYEAECLRATGSVHRWQVRWFHYPMDKIVRSVMEDEKLVQISMQPTLAIWYRFSGHGRLRHVLFSLPRFLIKIGRSTTHEVSSTTGLCACAATLR